MNKRIFYYDALRAMAIIGIVFCHVSLIFLPLSLNNSDLYIVAFFDCFRDFSIPVFVMLSGALLLNRSESFKVFFKKRLSRLLIPFFFWVIVYIVYSNDYSLSNVSSIFFGASGSLGVTFWFVWMIIIMYIGIFIINKFIQLSSDKIVYILAIISLLYFMIIELDIFNPYSSRIIYFASFITYIIFGYVITRRNVGGKYLGSFKMVILSLAGFVLLYGYYIFGFVVPRSLSSGSFVYLSYFNFLILVLSLSVFVLFKYLSETGFMNRVEESKFGDAIVVVSRYSFGIYLVHYLIIHILRYNVLTHIDHPNPFVGILLVVSFTLILSLIILYVLSRTPILNRLSGVN